jgi:hypothetical protein
MPDKPEGLNLPEDLGSHFATLGDNDLGQFETDATAEFDSLNADENLDAAGLGRMTALADAIKGVRGFKEKKSKDKAELAAQRSALATQIHGTGDGDGDKAVTASTVPVGGATTQPAKEANAPKLNLSLADAQANAPKIPERRNESAFIASADIPGFTTGGKLDGINELVAAMQTRARALPISQNGDSAMWYPVASLERKYKYNLDLDATPEQVNEVLTAASDVDALIAAGGWCAPSQISYDFFNIVCEDGMLDLPSIGINRGGIRWPTSPSFGDLVGNSAMWSWNETQDIAAVTGTAQSGTKTCGRVTCPSFNESRLECDGLCLTVGNLTEDAYPELIANHTRLLFAAFAHRQNGRRIQKLLTDMTQYTISGTAGGSQGVVAPLIGAISLAAIDYRDKYAMCEGATLEVILPRWVRSAMRSDLRKRTGVDLLEVADARLMRMFDAEGVRVQWVNDWQVRTSGFPGQTAPILNWPSTVEFMLYAPGTYVQGNGLKLNLGVIRDSVLNATNDHTAEWMEECWLIFRPGHEGRRYVVPICPDGSTGAADLTGCSV